MPFFTKYNVYSFTSNFMWNFFLTLPTIQSNFLQEYRAKVKEYNQDIKTAGYAVSFVR